MARVVSNITIEGLQGRIGDLVFCQFNGKTYVRRRPQSLSKQTKAQRTMRREFGQASKLAAAIKDDLTRIAIWEETFDKQNRYPTIRGLAVAYFQKALKDPKNTYAKLSKLETLDPEILKSIGV